MRTRPQAGAHPGDRPLTNCHDTVCRQVLAVVIPCFNVEKQIAGVVRTLPDWVTRVIAVDDGSSDGTLGLLRELADEDPRLRVIARDANGGVGAAMVTGYRAALDSGADFIVKMDGDGQMDGGELPRLLQPLLEDRADYAKGNRFRHVKDLGSMPRLRLLGNIALTLTTKLVSGYWYVFDAQNGFTAISRGALEALPLERLDPTYAFENSMLSLLNLDDRSVADVAMPAIYGDERSSLQVPLAILSYPPRLVRMLLHRLTLKYLVYDVSPIAIYGLAGSLLLGFGATFGGYHWWLSIQSDIPATTRYHHGGVADFPDGLHSRNTGAQPGDISIAASPGAPREARRGGCRSAVLGTNATHDS